MTQVMSFVDWLKLFFIYIFFNLKLYISLIEN
jgi:hypothetical protein